MGIKVTINDVSYSFKEPTIKMSQMASQLAKKTEKGVTFELIKLCLDKVDNTPRSPIEVDVLFADMPLNIYTQIAKGFEENMGKFENSAIIEEIF